MKIKLKQAFDLQMGKTPARNQAENWGGNHRWVSIADIGNAEKYIAKTKECITDAGINASGIKVVPQGTVIMSFKLSIGKTAITAQDMYTNEAIIAFIDKKIFEIDPNYLYHLCCGTDWTAGTNKAVMGLTLNKATLLEKEISLPDICQQRKIAAKLDKIDAIIADRQQQLTMIEQAVKSRFIELFGDPVQNPYGWSTRPLLEMGYCKNGMNFHTGDNGVEMHCLGVGDFKDYAVIDGTNHLPIISLNEAPPEESMLQDGDIVFVRSNGNKALVGRCLVVYPHSTPTTYSGFCIRYRLTSDEVDTIYLLRVLKTDSMRKKMAGRGANIQNLNQQILATLDIPTPPMDLQEQFAAFVAQTDKSKLAVQQGLQELETLKKSLMQQYFS